MEIIIAEHSGFCFGVNRAIEMAFKEAENKERTGNLYTCGHLIHNGAVVKRLEDMGAKMISSLSEASEGDTVIVRSHGEPRVFTLVRPTLMLNMTNIGDGRNQIWQLSTEICQKRKNFVDVKAHSK